jgi:GT2 family glycosyltransferase
VSGAPARVSVVFVTRDRRAELAAALAAVEGARPPAAEVLVVDNGSTDGTRELLAARYPGVRVLPQTANLGVARGRNVGIAAAAHECVVCIDDDAVPTDPAFLAPLVRRLEAEDDVAVVAGRVVDAARGVTLRHEFPRRGLSPREVEREQDVAYFVGCAFAVRRGAFLAVGGFYERLHYGLEELDLAYRLLEAGWRLRYAPDFVVRHGVGAAAGRGAGWHFHLMRSRVLVALRSLPWWALVPHLVIWHGAMLTFGLRAGQAGAVLRGAVAGWRDAGDAWRTRRRISPPTVRRVRRLAGRLLW